MNQIEQTWNCIICENNILRFNVDVTIVQFLENRCSQNEIDRVFIQSHRHDIFSTIQNVNQKNNIWINIMSIDSVIFFIFIFLKNIKHLEICVKILKQLLSSSFQKTIHQTFYRLHNDQKTFKIQMTKHYLKNRIETIANIVHWKIYRQLWFFVMRHFFEMIDHSSKTENFKFKIKLFNSKYDW